MMFRQSLENILRFGLLSKLNGTPPEFSGTPDLIRERTH